MGTEVRGLMRKGLESGNLPDIRSQDHIGDETGDSGKHSTTVLGSIVWHFGGFNRLYRQVIEEAGAHSCLSAPILNILSTLR